MKRNVAGLVPLSLVACLNAALAIWYYAKANEHAQLIRHIELALNRHAMDYVQYPPDPTVHLYMEHCSSRPCPRCRGGEDGHCNACLGRGWVKLL